MDDKSWKLFLAMSPLLVGFCATGEVAAALVDNFVGSDVNAEEPLMLHGVLRLAHNADDIGELLLVFTDCWISRVTVLVYVGG